MKPVFVALMISLAVSMPLNALAQTCNQGSHLARPIPLGVCGSNLNSSCNGCAGGTLGALVKDSSGNKYILGNTHVLARYGAAKVGEGIVQPIACGTSTDKVANLSEFIFWSSGNNVVDAAIAKIISGDVSTNGSIYNIGPISNVVATAFVGLPVQKMGCGSCASAGQVFAINQYFTVTNACNGTTSWVNQIVVELSVPVSEGDSGALLVTQGACPQPVGLMFAASSGGQLGDANPIGTVLSDLGVSVVNGTGCASPTQSQTTIPTDQAEASAAVDQYAKQLMSIPGVWGVGVRVDQAKHAFIAVSVDELTTQIHDSIPASLNGIPVQVFVEQRPHLLGKPDCPEQKTTRGQPR